MEELHYQVRRIVDESQMILKEVQVRRGWWLYGGPEERVVVGEEGEEDAQEERGCWKSVSRSMKMYATHGGARWVQWMGEDLRQTMRKVANFIVGMLAAVRSKPALPQGFKDVLLLTCCSRNFVDSTLMTLACEREGPEPCELVDCTSITNRSRKIIYRQRKSNVVSPWKLDHHAKFMQSRSRMAGRVRR